MEESRVFCKMAVVRVEPDVPLVARSVLDNPNLLLVPEQKLGEVSHFKEPIVLAILDNLKLGLELDDCAALVNVPYDEVKKWDKENTGNFGNLVKKAKAEFKRLHVMKVTRGQSDWKPSAFMLERKFRREYGKESKEASTAPGKQTYIIGGKEIEF